GLERLGRGFFAGSGCQSACVGHETKVPNPIMECSVILSEASLRAKSKDPHLVASSAWVADPSQAQDDSQPVEDPRLTGRCTYCSAVRTLSAWRMPSMVGMPKAVRSD